MSVWNWTGKKKAFYFIKKTHFFLREAGIFSLVSLWYLLITLWLKSVLGVHTLNASSLINIKVNREMKLQPKDCRHILKQ